VQYTKLLMNNFLATDNHSALIFGLEFDRSLSMKDNHSD
jgi:hypothetical protein